MSPTGIYERNACRAGAGLLMAVRVVSHFDAIRRFAAMTLPATACRSASTAVALRLIPLAALAAAPLAWRRALR